MARFKKFLAATTIMFTVLSLCVVAAPKASAATAGDLIKMNGLSSIYYLGADGKRYVFPNESTYFSWYSDFSRVVTVSQSELEALPLGANVTVRPGTKLVKITTNPKVFAVTANGTLVAIPDEATAKALYGDAWAKRVIDVSDAFFTNYKNNGATLTSSAYPQGSLVKFGTGADVYYINADGKAQKISSEAAFNANRFNWNDVITSSLAMPVTGDDITGTVSTLTDTASGAGGVAGSGTGLSVKLSNDTAASANVPSLSTLVAFASVDFTAANDGPVTISDVTFTRFGTGDAAEFDGGYLYDGNTRLTSNRSVNTSDHKISFSNIALKVNAGATKTLTLRMNADTNVSGSHSFRIVSASDIVANGASVSGSFPISGNMMSFATVEASTITLTNLGSAADRKVGDKDVTVGEFQIANNNKEDVTVSRIRLKQDGDASNAAANNYSLDLDGTKVVTGVTMADKYVDFVLATPFVVKKSTNIAGTIRADIQTDVNKTIQLYLNDVVDLDAKGTAYGNFYSAKITNTSLTDTTATTYTIKGSAINVSFDAAATPASDIKKNTTKVPFATFKIKAESDDVNIERLPFLVNMSPASTTMKLDNMIMIDAGNNVSYSVASNPTGAATQQAVRFENVYLKKGVQYTFVVKADVPDETYTTGGSVGTIYSTDFTTQDLTAKYVASDATVSTTTDFSATSLTGKQMTIQQPKVTFSKTTINAANATKGTQGILLYEGKVTANNVDNLKVSRIKATSTLTGPMLTNGSISSSFDRMMLYKVNSDGTETSLNEISSLSGTTLSFSGFTLDVPKGTSNAVVFRIRGNVKSTVATGTIALAIGGNNDSDHIVRDANNNSLTAAQYTSINYTNNGVITIVGTGTYTAAFEYGENGTNVDNNVLAGSKALIGRLRMTASNETAKIVDMALYNGGTVTGTDVGSFYLYKEATMTTLLGTASMGTDGFIKFESVNFEVPTTGITYVYVAANLKGIDYSANPISNFTAVTGRTVKLYSTSTASYVTKVTGVSTGETLTNPEWTATSVTKIMTTSGAIVSGVTTSFANATLSNGVAKKIFSFKVTAPSQTTNNIDYDGAALSVNLASTTFNVATTTDIALTTFKVQRVGGSAGKVAASVAGVASAMNFAAGTFAIDFPSTYGTNADINIKPGETAEYEIYADIANVGTSETVQISIGNINTLQYNHNTASSAGVQGTDSTMIYPILVGVSDVVGGSLTN